jgi:hypothetical protein
MRRRRRKRRDGGWGVGVEGTEGDERIVMDANWLAPHLQRQRATRGGAYARICCVWYF